MLSSRSHQWNVLVALRALIMRVTTRVRIRISPAIQLDHIAEYFETIARELRGGAHPVVAIRAALHRADPFVQALLRPLSDELRRGTRLVESARVLVDLVETRELSNIRRRRTRRRDQCRPSIVADIVGSFAAVIVATESVGAITPRAFDGLARNVREQAATLRLLGAASAQARLSGLILGITPLVFCVVLVRGQAAAGAFLTGHPLGRLAGISGLLLDGIGMIWLQRQAGRVAT